MPFRSRTAGPDVDALIASTIAGASHALTGWIVGITFALFPLAFGMLSLLVNSAVGFTAESLLFPAGMFFLGIVVIPGACVLAVRALNGSIATRVRRLVAEGRRCEGTIVQAIRRSMTQSRVSVQGEGFTPFDMLLSTSLPDAALVGRKVEVYVHPNEPYAPLLIPPS